MRAHTMARDATWARGSLALGVLAGLALAWPGTAAAQWPAAERALLNRSHATIAQPDGVLGAGTHPRSTTPEQALLGRSAEGRTPVRAPSAVGTVTPYDGARVDGEWALRYHRRAFRGAPSAGGSKP